MRVVRLRTTRPESFWILDNIHLSPYNDTSPPFDWDDVYPEGKEFIERSIRVFGRVELVEDPETTEALMDIIPDDGPVYELPNQAHHHAARYVTINQEEDAFAADDEIIALEPEPEPEPQEVVADAEEPELEQEEEPEPPKPPSVSLLEVTEENHKMALKLLAKKVNVVQRTIKNMPQSQDTRQFVFACIEAEKARKNRKSVMAFLEGAFLAIPPEVE